MIPLIPLLCLAAASGWQNFEGKLRWRWLKAGIFLAIVSSLLLPALQSDRLFLRRDTRTECADWFKKNAGTDAVVVVDSRFFGPPLRQSPAQIREKYELLSGAPADRTRKKRLDLALIAAENQTAYQTYYLALENQEASSRFLFHGPFVAADWTELKAIRAEYLVMNYSEYYPAKHLFKDSISAHLQLEASFSPFIDPAQKMPIDRFASTAAPHRPADLFSRSRLGPYLEVYRIKYD